MKFKSFYALGTGILLSVLTITACQKDLSSSSTTDLITSRAAKSKLATEVTSLVSPYNVTLLLKNVPTGDCNYLWMWSVTNPNPGNGTTTNTKGLTVQDLSHWGFNLSNCTDPENALSASNVVKVEYKKGGDPNVSDGWMLLSTAIGKDKSQSCTGDATVFKFDAGTNGSTPTYYRLTLNDKFYEAPVSGYFKSGVNTGCGVQNFQGIGCKMPLCFYSQGYWLAKPQTVWGKSVTFADGTNTLQITQEQGNEIWDSRKGNMYGNNNSYAKKALFQATAIQMSVCNIESLPATLKANYYTVAHFLATLTFDQILKGDYDPKDAPAGLKEAIGYLGNYISTHHCDSDEYTDVDTVTY